MGDVRPGADDDLLSNIDKIYSKYSVKRPTRKAPTAPGHGRSPPVPPKSRLSSPLIGLEQGRASMETTPTRACSRAKSLHNRGHRRHAPPIPPKGMAGSQTLSRDPLGIGRSGVRMGQRSTSSVSASSERSNPGLQESDGSRTSKIEPPKPQYPVGKPISTQVKVTTLSFPTDKVTRSRTPSPKRDHQRSDSGVPQSLDRSGSPSSLRVPSTEKIPKPQELPTPPKPTHPVNTQPGFYRHHAPNSMDRFMFKPIDILPPPEPFDPMVRKTPISKSRHRGDDFNTLRKVPPQPRTQQRIMR